MSKLDFIKKLYNGKNCYSDHMTEEELNLLHISSKVESIISEMLRKGKIVFLTGNPGDGKTFIIRAIKSVIDSTNAYTKFDMNSVIKYEEVASEIAACYSEHRPAVIAINEYPFLKLCQDLRLISPEMSREINAAKKSAITYDTSSPLTGRVAVIDLNERNILDTDRNLLSEIIDKFIELLSEDTEHNTTLEYNIKAVSIPEIKAQVIALISLASSECVHIAIRDILGAFAFIFTACKSEEHEGEKYYSAIFESSNSLLTVVQQFDPIYLSSPNLDEALWNGEETAGWILEAPKKWPNDPSYEDDIDGAIACFKEIKRRYYFENVHGQSLLELQPDEIRKCAEIFTSFDSQKKKIKERIIKSINKLFLPSSDDKKQLHIWTTHRYDMSIPAAAAISRKSIDAGELDIQMPRPADWLPGLEYIPNHIILKPKGKNEPVLRLDIDFLRTLDAIDEGYPVGLLAPQYEQAAAMFLQQLDDNGLTEENDDNEVILASRRKSYKKLVFIQDGKYGFEEE
jgi:ABC-type iron transport system FetAB ATPase subunit